MKLANVKGVLCDLDGVLYVGESLIEGVVETLSTLRKQELKIRFLTNTTRQSQAQLLEKLQGFGVEVVLHEIISPPIAAAQVLKDQGIESCYLCTQEAIKADFADFRLTDEQPDAVVIGDIGQTWDYALLNKLFHYMRKGAKLIALHQNRFLRREYGWGLDIGPFVAALEYACNEEALVVGKPSRAFFDLALQQIDLPAAEVVMIGDDLDSDIKGAQEALIRTVLVRTGKYTAAYAQRSPIRPTLVLDSLNALPQHLI